MITVMGLSGSLRRASYNAAVLRAAGSLMPSDSELRIESIAGIPLYDGDDEAAHGVPELVSRLKDAITAADGLLLVTPEYNNSIPGVLKNAIDWASRPYGDSAWNGKAVALMGASVGTLGTARAQYHLRQMFVFLNMYPVNQPEVMISNAANRFDEKGNLVDEPSRKLIKQLLEELVAWTRRLGNT